MKILLQQGANPNATNNMGQTPLMLSQLYGNKALDKWQDATKNELAQKRALMRKLLTNAAIAIKH
jgi:ankyrin repeat protein